LPAIEAAPKKKDSQSQPHRVVEKKRPAVTSSANDAPKMNRFFPVEFLMKPDSQHSGASTSNNINRVLLFSCS
jgi:hypothetical protein